MENTRQQIHTSKYIELVLSKPTTTKMRAKWIDNKRMQQALHKQHSSCKRILLPLQEPSADWRRMHIKAQDKVANEL